MRGAGEPSTSQPPIECPPEFLELKNIWAFLWAPLDFIREECSVKDNGRHKKVEKPWRKCFHYGLTLLGLIQKLILPRITSWSSRVKMRGSVPRHLKAKVPIL
jgi:hypothetical protein